MNWTHAELIAYEARRKTLDVKPADGVEREKDLHEQILAYCRSRGWIPFHARMDKPSTATIGQPDFLIWADGGREFAIECKSRTGKLSVEQMALRAQANRLGHKVYLVHSFREFVEVTQL